jgi:hypothetical protein
MGDIGDDGGAMWLMHRARRISIRHRREQISRSANLFGHNKQQLLVHVMV